MTINTDLTTIAFLCGGFLASDEAVMTDALSGVGISQIDIVDELTCLAPRLDVLYLQVQDDFDGVFAYDIAAPMGRWYCEQIAKHQRLPTEEEFTQEARLLLGMGPATKADLALDKIQRLLSGNEWEADDLDTIAEIVRGTGREILDYDDLPEEA